MGAEFTKKDLRDFIIDLDSKIGNLNGKEIQAVLKSREEVNLQEMIKLIKYEVLKSIDNY